VAGVALDDMDRHFAWQAWHLWHWVGSGGALASQAAKSWRCLRRLDVIGLVCSVLFV